MITVKHIGNNLPPIKVAREAQSEYDKQKHAEYKEAEKVKALLTSIHKGPKPPMTDKKAQRIMATDEWQQIHDGKTNMAKLANDGLFRQPDNRDFPRADGSVVTSATYGPDGKLIPQAGQWYNIIVQDYYVMWANPETYFLNAKNSCLQYIASKHIVGPMPWLRDIEFVSLGRFIDILDAQPSQTDLSKAGYTFVTLNHNELTAFGDWSIETAIPVYANT